MQMSTILRASAISLVAPHASKNSLLPPNVPHPKHSSGTLNPDLPSCLYSIALKMPHPHTRCMRPSTEAPRTLDVDAAEYSLPRPAGPHTGNPAHLGRRQRSLPHLRALRPPSHHPQIETHRWQAAQQTPSVLQLRRHHPRQAPRLNDG